MLLKRIEIYNFKQFAGKNSIKFNTKGKYTIVLGKNGSGKTNLLSFFHWAFYGSDDHVSVYNYELMEKTNKNNEIIVKGVVEFTHIEEEYTLVRVEKYKKIENKIMKIPTTFEIEKNTGIKEFIPKPEQFIKGVLSNEIANFIFYSEESHNDFWSKRFDRTLKNLLDGPFGLAQYSISIYNLNRIKKTLNGKNLDEINIVLELLTNLLKEKENLIFDDFNVHFYDNLKQIMNMDLKTEILSRNYLNFVRNDMSDHPLAMGDLCAVEYCFLGAVLKLLKRINIDVSKDYPLILDKSQSFLDMNQLKNVFRLLTSYANQIVIITADKRVIEIIDEIDPEFIYCLKRDLDSSHISIQEKNNN